MPHPTIDLFEQRAALLDLQGSDKGLDEAIADLAVWTVEWIGVYGCERGKRAGLIAAWPG